MPDDRSAGITSREAARVAYDLLAPAYDQVTAQNNYEMWLGATLLPELEKHGLQKGRVLDVGCGTGRAFGPLQARGWEIVGCDVSPGMLQEAGRKFQNDIALFEADARSLPQVDGYLGLPTERNFDLILLLNDVVNYTTEDGDLESVFAGVKRNLIPGHGLAIFDANTLALYGDAFTFRQMEEKMDAGDLTWEGLTEDVKPGFIYEARISGLGVKEHLHRQRHWPRDQIEAALETSGLRLLAALGQQDLDEEIRLLDPPDETRDHKVVYIATDQAKVRRGL
ncbi:MAG TPA: methyltransferase domain-containing protein [Solirubrobacterales bacterium]